MRQRIQKTVTIFDYGLLLACCLALFAVQPLLTDGLPTTADLTIHLYRTQEFMRAWAPGVIFPRWSPNLAYGYGYPLFVFAPPLPYLLAAGFHLLGFSLETAFKLLLSLTTLLYAVGMYLLARDLLRSVWGGLIASVAFTFAPFALREALLYGGNVPQYLAIGLYPWPLWAATRAAQTGRWRWSVLAGSFYGAIILSHLFHALVFSVVFGLYLLLLLASKIAEAQWRRDAGTQGGAETASHSHATRFSPFTIHHSPFIIRTLLPLPIGLGLTAFFWLPAFFERAYTRAQTEVYLEKSPFFIRYPHWAELLTWIAPLDTRAANPHVPLSLGLVTVTLAGLGLLALLTYGAKGLARKNSPDDSSPRPNVLAALFFAVLAAGAALMILPQSRPVWDALPLLQVAEFPWRLLGLANLGLAVTAGAAILLLPRRWQAWAAAPVIAVQLLAVAPLLYPVTAFTRYDTPTIADQITYERSSQSIGTTTLGEYLPAAVNRPPTTSPLVDEFMQGHYPERLDRAGLPPTTQAGLLAQNAVTHRYRLDAAAPVTLRFLQFYYPGWQADLDDQPLAITPEPDTGLMLLDVPAGQHTLTLRFGETPLRLLGLALSGLTVAGLLVLAAVRLRKADSSQPSAIISEQPTLHWRIGLPAVAGVMLIALLVTPLLRPLFSISSPPERALPAQHATDFRFENGIQLIGYSLSGPVIEPGGYAQVVLYWQTDSAPYRVNLQPFVHLDRLDDFSTIADATNYTPGDVTTEQNVPTFHWDNARYVRDEHDLTVPPDAPPLAYAVRAGLIDSDSGQLIPLADGSGDTVWLDTINVSPLESPPVAQPLNVTFSGNGDSITLLGVNREAGAGSQELGEADSLNFAVVWQAEATPRTDYTVFAQLLTPDGQLVTGFDRPPLDGAYPTSMWLPGQAIADPRTLPLGDIPPGNYRLVVGLYNATTGQRLSTPQGADFVELTTITVEE